MNIPLVDLKAQYSIIREEIDAAIHQVIRRGEFILGSEVEALEREVGAYLDIKYAIGVASGTDALRLALLACEIRPGDEVITTPFTFIATAEAITQCGAKPVFVDIDPKTYNIDPAKIEEKVTEKTKAILPVHLYGQSVNMAPILKLAPKYNLKVIEDCAQAHMSKYHGKIVGTIGEVGCFSFQQSKHITTGDGGMIISNEDMKFGRSLRQCFDKGWPRDKPGRDHYFLAPNYHMTELQAAVGIAQIRKYSESIEARKKSGKALVKRLRKNNLVTLLTTLPDTTSTFFSFSFLINIERLDVTADVIVKELCRQGLKCALGYPGPIPLYMYPVIREKKTFGSSGLPFTSPYARKEWSYESGLCPKAEKACRETIVLPWNERITQQHVDSIADTIIAVLCQYEI